MKKILKYTATCLVLFTLFSISSLAVTFKAGDGYDVYKGSSYSEATVVRKSPVTMTNNADGSVTVEQGGYYCNYSGDNNYGGVSTATKVGLNGLRVFIEFEKVPTVTNDCFFGVTLLQQDHIFNTGNMATTGGYNPLIRFNVPNVEFYNPSFGGVGTSEINGDLFGLKSGDTLGMTVEYKYGQYVISYDHNDMYYEVPLAWTKDASDLLISQGGKAYVVVTGSLLGENSDWKYTVSVSEGTGITQSELSSKSFEESKLSAKAEIDALQSDVENNNNRAFELAWDKTDDEEVLEAWEDSVEAVNEIFEASCNLDDATNEDEVNEALKQARSAKSMSSTALETIEFLVDTHGYDDDYSDTSYDWDSDDWEYGGYDYDYYEDYDEAESEESGIIGFLKKHFKTDGDNLDVDDEFSEVEEQEASVVREEDEKEEASNTDSVEEEDEEKEQISSKKSRLVVALICAFSVVLAIALAIVVLIILRKRKNKTK